MIAENLSVKRNNVMESKEINPAQPQMYHSAGNVDYSLIKMIVKECVKEALSENTKTLTGIRLGENGKIQLLDNKGYLYEGVLEKKRKVVKKNK
jgi:predicted transcriptional regulator